MDQLKLYIEPTELQRLAMILVTSGICDSKDGKPKEVKLAQCAFRIQYGYELGIPPVTALKNIYIVKDQPALSYQLIGTLIRKHKGYDYDIIEMSNTEAIIELTRFNKKRRFTYTIENARAMNKADSDNYRRQPDVMLLSRCLTKGVNAFMPEVLGGNVYTPEDFGESQEEDTELDKIADSVPDDVEEIEIDRETGEAMLSEKERRALEEREADEFIAEIESLKQKTTGGKHS